MGLPEEISSWIKRKAEEAGAKGVVVGLSGGLDSSVVAVLCKRALPEDTLGLIMPCLSTPEDLKHARLVAERFQIPTRTIDLGPIFTGLVERLKEARGEGANRIAIANIKPRLRMIALYYFANTLNYLVVGTGNKSEVAMGYFTKYGDGGVDILPLGDLLKSQVRDLAQELHIPEEIISKVPSAGLWEGQTDEGEMGITYEDLDRVLKGIEEGDLRGLDEGTVKKVNNKMSASTHKRQPPPVFKILGI